MAPRNLSPSAVSARTIAITSGKGGVGKTTLTVNLGLSLAKRGYRVCVFDADTGLANINIMLNLNPVHTVQQVLDGSLGIRDILLQGPHNLHIIPGATGLGQFPELSPAQQQQLLAQLTSLERDYDFILIDTAAGIAPSVLHFVGSAQQCILVVTPEPTSLTDAFSLLKLLKNQHYQREPIQVVVNMARSQEQAQQVYQRIASATRKYLQLELHFLSYIHADESMPTAVNLQRPVALYPDSHPLSATFSGLAKAMIETRAATDASLADYWHSLSKADDEQSHQDRPGIIKAPTQGHQASQTLSSTILTTGELIRLLGQQQWTREQWQQLARFINDEYESRFSENLLSPDYLLEKPLSFFEQGKQGHWKTLLTRLNQVFDPIEIPERNNKAPAAGKQTAAESTPPLQAAPGSASANSGAVHEGNVTRIRPSVVATAKAPPASNLDNSDAKPGNARHGDTVPINDSSYPLHYDNAHFGSQERLLQGLRSRDAKQSLEQFLNSFIHKQ